MHRCKDYTYTYTLIDSAASNCHAYNYYFKQNLHFVAWWTWKCWLVYEKLSTHHIYIHCFPISGIIRIDQKSTKILFSLLIFLFFGSFTELFSSHCSHKHAPCDSHIHILRVHNSHIIIQRLSKCSWETVTFSPVMLGGIILMELC